MPLDPDAFFERVERHAGPDGRLPLSRMTGWEIFPFEPDGLKVVGLEPPQLPEPARAGDDPTDCVACRHDRPEIWSDEHWRLSTLSEPSGVPLLLMLQPHEHFDLATLPDDRAAEMGRLLSHIARAVEQLPHVARAHVSRWGDGGAHLHIFIFARPAGFSQLRGTCLAIWDDLLPPVPHEIWEEDAATVGRSLAVSYGGQAAGS
ncbi:MAG: hypothetical protein ACYDGN_10405 [Acidimicrobiales bacterium]